MIAPIDKAMSNAAFICHQFYTLVLIKKLGLLNNNNDTNQTYKQAFTSNINITNNYSNILKSKFNGNLDNANKQLPYMHWLPRLHKTPSKVRFIVATVQYSLKPHSKAVSSALKILYKQIEAYHTKSFFVSGAKTL